MRRERPKTAAPLTTTGVAEQRDQPEQSVSSENSAGSDNGAGVESGAGSEKQDAPVDEADREKLYQDFLKWQFDRNLFGTK